jgi:signal transduction histidine kinase/DNA-binding CsgD family transcriptional regulator
MLEAPIALAERRPPAAAHVDQLAALIVSADLSCCELAESARILHGWLRGHCEHDAIAITANGSGAPLSCWTSSTFEAPAEGEWWAGSSGDVAHRMVVAAGGAASSSVTIVVVPTDQDAVRASIVEPALQVLARVLGARVGSPATTDTAQLSLAHAVAAERDRVAHELTDQFAQHLHTILNHLRDDHVGDPRARAHSATSVASRALVELRERRRTFGHARRADEAFAVLARELGDLAGAAGIQLERTLAGREGQTVATSVLDAACWITRAALLNVVEHASARRARIVWSLEDDVLAVSIDDDGCGFDTERTALAGLDAMRRRAEVLGGALELASAPGWGTRLRARLRLRVESAMQADESASALIGTLRERELEVLRLMAVGHRNRDIATELVVSQHTVKFHVANIFEKLGVRTRAEAAAVAFAAGIHPRTAPAPAAASTA